MAGTAAALFDVDGTLVDSTYLHTISWWETLREYGHTVPMALIGRSIGLGTAHKALYSRFWPTLTPLPGAADLLRACADRGWTVVLASSASARELEVLRKV